MIFKGQIAAAAVVPPTVLPTLPALSASTATGVPTVSASGATARPATATPLVTLAARLTEGTPPPRPTETPIPTQPPPPTRELLTPTPTARALTVLDDFNRADGLVGDSWTGYPSRFVITGNQLAQTSAAINAIKPSIMFFNNPLPTTTTMQEMGLKIGALGDDGLEGEIALLLKWQGPPTAIDCNAIEVKYELKFKRVSVSICDDGTGSAWESRGSSAALKLNAGDFFSARVDEAGMVKVFQNGNLVHTATVADWEFNANPGRPGLRLEDAPDTSVDNFSAE